MKLAELFPDEDYRFNVRFGRSTFAEYFGTSANQDAVLAERRRWLQSAPQDYSAWLPDAAPLLDEAIAIAQNEGALSESAAAQLLAIADPAARCRALGELWEPDFLLLKADAAGKIRLLGGCVCFPSSWVLAEKIGQPIEFIHEPVPGLNETIGPQIQTFLARLRPGPAWLRTNWGLARSNELNLHPVRGLPRMDEHTPPSEIWLRVEHQALVALPRSGGVLFGIRIALHSIATVALETDTAHRLARALETMPPAVSNYKGLEPVRNRIVSFIRTKH